MSDTGATRIYPGQPPLQAYIYTARPLAVKVAKTMRKHFGHEAHVVGSVLICTADAYHECVENTLAPAAQVTAQDVGQLPDDSEMVETGLGCPRCGEQRVDELVWRNDYMVQCQSCKKVYEP